MDIGYVVYVREIQISCLTFKTKNYLFGNEKFQIIFCTRI